MEGEGGAPSAGAAAGGAGATTTTSPALLAIESQFDDVLDSINNIFVAAGDGELSKVQAFVASGVSVNSQDEYGYTPLCVVAQLNSGALTPAVPPGRPRACGPQFTPLPSPPPLHPLPALGHARPPPSPTHTHTHCPHQPCCLQLWLRGSGAVAAGAGGAGQH